MSVDTVQRALLMPGQRNASKMPAHGRDAAAVVSTLGGERTALVVGDDPELAVALRDRLDRAYVTVREVRTSEALVAVRACAPWPWMLIGDGAVPAEAVAELSGKPVLVVWRGEPPPGLPAHAVGAQRFAEVAAAVERALSAEVLGMRLAVGDGVVMPDGMHAGSAALEALVAAHPRPLFAATHHFRSAERTLSAHGVPLRPGRHGGGIALLPVADA